MTTHPAHWRARVPRGLVAAGLAIACGANENASNPVPGLTTTGEDPGQRTADLPAPPSELVPLAAALADVCRSGYRGDPARATFDPMVSAPHRLLFLAADGSAHSWNNVLPVAWRPTSVEQVELVACVGQVERTSIETCEYVGTGRTITRFQSSVDVQVVTPGSGAATLQTLRGAVPERCPSSTTNWQDIAGGAPRSETVKSEIVDRYVLAPVCGESRPLASCLQCWRDAAEATPSGCGFAGGQQYSEALPNVRTGEPVAIDWRWESYPDALFLPSSGCDWSLSPDAPSLASLAGAHNSFVPLTARAYAFVAQARLPGTATGLVVQTRRYAVEALDRPVIEDLLGTSGPAFARVGQPSRFRFTISGRPPLGRSGEALRWTWLERPSGSTSAEPGMEVASSFWSFVPDVPGSYRVQVEYSDGIGFSEPVTTAPITAIAGPVVTGLIDRTASVGASLRLEATVSYAVGFPAFSWTLIEIAAGSSLTPSYYSSVDTNSLVFNADVAGAYRFEVVVTDKSGQSEPVRFTVTAS
jgi:hypothetical protein